MKTLKFIAVLVALLVLACRGEEVPQNTMLWHVHGWRTPPSGARQDVRTSLATFIGFRKNGEYVEVHCSVIEQPDQTVLIQSGRPCVSAVGRWIQKRSEVEVTRETASVTALCSQPSVTFKVQGQSVTANLTGEGEATYSPVTRFVAPEFESHVEKAKSGAKCAPADR